MIVILTDGEPGFGISFNGQVRHIVSCGDLPPKGCATGCGCVDNDTCYSDDALLAEVGKLTQVIHSAPARSIYMAGIGELSMATLDDWATASGNDPINLFDMEAATAATTLRARLDTIRDANTACAFDVPTPAGTTFDKDTTNVTYTVGTREPEALTRTLNGSASGCGTTTRSWYFDNPSSPQRIVLCPSTCATLQQIPEAKLQVVYGCAVSVE